MGMYDYIICEYPIHGGIPSWINKHPFQTKDLDNQLETYHIYADGKFSVSGWTGTLNFYSSNIVGCDVGVYTDEGEDAEEIDCVAKIVNGIVVGKIKVTRKHYKAWAISKMETPKMPTVNEIEAERKRDNESLLNKRLYVLWGGETEGYWVKVVAENERDLVTQHEADFKYHHQGDFEILKRWDRDRIFFDTDAEALANLKRQQQEWEAKKVAWENFNKLS